MSTVKTYKGHDVPEGSQRFREASGDFYKKVNGVVSYWLVALTDRWTVVSSCSTGWDEAEELPQEPEQFVPVVGEECTLNAHISPLAFSDDAPVSCLVVAIYKDWIVLAREGWPPMTARLKDCELSPVKSECEKVCELAVAGISGVVDEKTLNMIVGQLYDAGMLSMPEAK